MRHAVTCLALVLLPATLASGAPPATVVRQRPLALHEAITLALARDESLLIGRESVLAAQAADLAAQGAYDPAFDAQIDYRRFTLPVNSAFSGAPAGDGGPTVASGSTTLALRQLLPTGGSVVFNLDAVRESTNSDFTLLTPAWSTRAGVALRQPLLRGRSIDAARAALKITASDRERTSASLRREVNETLASTEDAYWSLVAAREAVDVREQAVRLAEEQLAQTRLRVEAGASPETETSQPLAEMERRRGELYSAREGRTRAENLLKRLILGPDATAAWAETLVPTEDPRTATVPVDLEPSLSLALEHRAELEESRAELARRKAQSAFSRDTMKPGLDAFVSYDRLGLAGSVNPDALAVAGIPVTVPSYLEGGLGRSFGTLGDGRFDDVRAGLILNLPIGNRAARGLAGVTESSVRQAEASLSALSKQILSEVLDAIAAVETAAQRVESSRAGSAAAEVQLAAEKDRYAAGLSTSFLILTRQNDLSRARLEEIDASTDYQRARTAMGLATGTLLTDRGIELDNGTFMDDGK